jgi:hypothetical protein
MYWDDAFLQKEKDEPETFTASIPDVLSENIVSEEVTWEMLEASVGTVAQA